MGRGTPSAGVEVQEPEPDAFDPSEFGRHVHALLAGAPRDGAHPEALALAARFESSDLGRGLASAARIEREFDFLLAIEDIVLRGQIDLWFDGGIVDYKTDDVSAAEAPARAQSYALQLQLLSRPSGASPEATAGRKLRPPVR